MPITRVLLLPAGVLLVAAFGLWRLAPLSGAAVSPVRTVNTDAPTDSRVDWMPRIAADSRGHWVVVWRGCPSVFCHPAVGDEGDILFSRSTNNGDSWSAPSPLHDDAATDIAADEAPDIAADGHGHWVVVWVSDNRGRGGAAGPDLDLMVSRSSDAGRTWSMAKPLNSDALGDNREENAATINTDGSGVWIAVWYASAKAGDPDIYFARSTDNGLTWSEPALIGQSLAFDEEIDIGPQLAINNSGDWIVQWHVQGSPVSVYGEDGDTLFARSVDKGVTWSAPRPMRADALTDVSFDGLGGMAGKGKMWLAVWNTIDGEWGGDMDIALARSFDRGQTWSVPTPLSDSFRTDSAYDSGATISTDGAGRWYVAWVSDQSLTGTGDGDFDIYYVVSTDDGQTWSTPNALNSNAFSDEGTDTSVRLELGKSGRWLAVWMSTNAVDNTVGDEDVFFAVFSCSKGLQTTVDCSQ